MEINGFNNEYDFLSNFYPSKVFYNGVMFENSEAAFQAQKEPSRAMEFSKLLPNEAKRLGRRVNIRDDWETAKDEIMFDIVFYKFSANKNLGERLKRTGDAHLVEGNYWHDNYWGDCHCHKCKNEEGKNVLGFILEKVRTLLNGVENNDSNSK